MRRSKSYWKYVLAPSAVGSMLYCLTAPAAERVVPPATPGVAPSADRAEGTLVQGNGTIRLVQAPPPGASQPPGALQPPGAIQPPGVTPPPGAGEPGAGTPGITAPPTSPTSATAASALGGAAGPTSATPTGGSPLGSSASAAPASASQTNAGPGAGQVAGGAASQGLNTSDAGDLLNRSQGGVGVEVQRRSPIVTDPRIRGYHVGEIFNFVDGIFAVPTRQDLDTIASKVDSSSIRNATVIKGPYSARYGPGLAFIDIETLGAPRYKDGAEAHGSTSLNFKTNGEQWRGRQAFWGGGEDWGFRLGYDLAAGNDYVTGGNAFPLGAGIHMTSSYNNQNIDLAAGFDLTPNTHLDFRIFRQDLENVEFPGQIYNIQNGITDSYSARLAVENQDYFDRMSSDAWYSYGRFNGNNLNPTTRRLIPILNNPATGFVGFTDGDVVTPGFRQMVTWGKEKTSQFTLGVDLRYVSQRLNEFDISANNVLAKGQPVINNPLPLSHSVNPGLFFDDKLLVSDWFTLKNGGRADFVQVDVDSIPLIAKNETLAGNLGTTQFGSEYNLLSGYSTVEFLLSQETTVYGNLGVGQRAPTLTELYASQPFLAVVQNGLNYVVGNPNISPEQAWQIDIGVRANYERFRGSASLFYAWIHNYVTFEEQSSIAGISGLKYVNTEMATLSGFELAGEYDLYCWLTPHATVSFVEGRDETRDSRGSLNIPPIPGSFSSQEPLPGMPPLDTRLGLRFHESGKDPKYGADLIARIVAAQNRVATSLQEVATPGFTVWDFRTYWQVNKKVLLTAGVENLFDKFYREHLDLRTGALNPTPSLNSLPITSPTGQYNYGPGVYQPGINFYFGAQLTY